LARLVLAGSLETCPKVCAPLPHVLFKEDVVHFLEKPTERTGYLLLVLLNGLDPCIDVGDHDHQSLAELVFLQILILTMIIFLLGERKLVFALAEVLRSPFSQGALLAIILGTFPAWSDEVVGSPAEELGMLLL